MAKKEKKEKPKGRPDKYESSTVAVKGTLEDILKASVKPKKENK